MDSITSSSKKSWLKKIWPISRFELKKFLPLFFLKFLASMVYAILTCMKDTLVVTGENAGAEVIPILKGWVVFPLSIICAALYSKLSNHFKRSTLFYSIISLFLGIIFLYGFVLYPNCDTITPKDSSNALCTYFGKNYFHWIAVYRNWIHSLFFVTAELWAQVVIFLLYWGFANHIFRPQEAKRTYTLFIAAGDIATIISSLLIRHYLIKNAGQAYIITLQSLISYTLVCGALMIGLYWWINRYVLSDVRYYNPELTKTTLNQKTKLTLAKSLKHILSSKYLLSIAVLVIGCALTINMIEVTWKAHLKMLYPNPSDYQGFMANLTFVVGVVALITVLLFGGNFLRKFGWRFSALISPIAIGFTGCLFFLACVFKNELAPLTSFFGFTPLLFIVLFGAFQNILSKVVKYSFFDSTKEMAYIPLDQELKVKGKAAIDMVGSRLGKSSSSWIQLFLIQVAGTGSVLSTTPYLIPVVLGMSIYWCYSVRYLDKELSEKEASFATVS